MNGSESSVLCRNAVSANIRNTTPPMSVTVVETCGGRREMQKGRKREEERDREGEVERERERERKRRRRRERENE